MGFDAGLAPPAIHVNEIDQATARIRADLVRAALVWVLTLSVQCFPGSTHLALRGAADRESVLLRQVTIYLAHTQLGLSESECAAIFARDKSQATRAMQLVERRRDEPGFNLKIEWLEAQVAPRARERLL